MPATTHSAACSLVSSAGAFSAARAWAAVGGSSRNAHRSRRSTRVVPTHSPIRNASDT